MNVLFWAFGITVAVMLVGWAISTMASDMQAPGRLLDGIRRSGPYGEDFDPSYGRRRAPDSGASLLWQLAAGLAIVAAVAFVAVNI